MKLSEYINDLQQLLKECGDLNCYYANDDEGNAYYSVTFRPSIRLMRKDDMTHYSHELYSEDEVISEYGEEFIVDHFCKVILVN